MRLIDWFALAILLSYPFAAFWLRSWISASVTRKIQYGYDEKLAQVRAELRLSEEKTRAELQAKGQEVAALRDGVLSTKAARRALVDKRRIEAVEQLWKSVLDLGSGPIKGIPTGAAI